MEDKNQVKTALRQVIEAEIYIGSVKTLAERLERKLAELIQTKATLAALDADLRKSEALRELATNLTQSTECPIAVANHDPEDAA